MNWVPVCFITILIFFSSIVCAMDGSSTNGIVAIQLTVEASHSISDGSSTHTQTITRQESGVRFVSGSSAYKCLQQNRERNGNIFTYSFLSYCKGTKNWEHFYDSYSSVGYVPKLEAKISKYVFKLENFDNNTYVRTRISFNEYIEKIVMISDIPEDRDIGQLMFTDTTDVMFDCGQHLNDSKYVYVGLINTTANKLTTMNTTTIMNRYSETYDGSILCCLFYKITEDSNKKTIERFISNKTLLRYYANDKIDSLFIVIIIATAATLLFAVVAIILIRKRCLNNNSLSRRPKLALPKKERKNPFYLNMLFRKECEQEIRAAESQKEELHYEEIL